MNAYDMARNRLTGIEFYAERLAVAADEKERAAALAGLRRSWSPALPPAAENLRRVARKMNEDLRRESQAFLRPMVCQRKALITALVEAGIPEREILGARATSAERAAASKKR